VNYIEVNKDSWNNRVGPHIESNFYNMKGFTAGQSSLKEIELSLVGQVSGMKILHLQCHFGQDTLSLARMGAKVTGVDFSEKAIEEARKLATSLNLEAEFICCDIYDLPLHHNDKYDIVFTSYGTIGWLPDIDKWAQVVGTFLKPNGKFIFVEFHPTLWMYDDDFTFLKYRYFQDEEIIEQESGTYEDREAEIEIKSISWNHGLAEVVTALLNQKLCLKDFQEYDYSPYNCFLHTVEFEPGKFRIAHLENKLPMVYSLVCEKEA